MQEADPIVTAVDMMQKTNWDCDMKLTKLNDKLDSVEFNNLDGSLNGIILPNVGGGIPKLEEAFLTDGYARDNPDHDSLIKQLKREIVKQVGLIDQLLPLWNKKRMTELDAKLSKDLEAKRAAFEKYHGETRTRVEELYGVADDDTYKVRNCQNPIFHLFL